jgi:RecA-family ATPase
MTGNRDDYDEAAELGPFAAGFASWSRVLAAASSQDVAARTKIFTNAADEVASYVAHGLDRAVAADELTQMATAYGLDDADQVQAIIARAFKGKRGNGSADESKQDALPTLQYVDLAGQLVEREWLITDRVPMGNVTLLSGEGAIGKSLLLAQLSAAVAVPDGKWLEIEPVVHGPVLYLSSEEDEHETRRRMEDIAQNLNVSRAKLMDNKLFVLSLAGEDAMLAVPDRGGIMHPTQLFKNLESDVKRLQPRLIAVDTVADTFGGKEIDRSQTRQFITMLRRVVLNTSSALVLCAHPSLAGINNDSGISGSTAWHNSVRARIYFKSADDENDPELRALIFKKQNYGPITDTINVRWSNGVFVKGDGTSTPVFDADTVERMFITMLTSLDRSGRSVSDKVSNTYAPSVFARECEVNISKNQFQGAMARLFAAQKIRVVTSGSPSRQRSKIILASPS